jgi:hypothetical protein
MEVSVGTPTRQGGITGVLRNDETLLCSVRANNITQTDRRALGFQPPGFDAILSVHRSLAEIHGVFSLHPGDV